MAPSGGGTGEYICCRCCSGGSMGGDRAIARRGIGVGTFKGVVTGVPAPSMQGTFCMDRVGGALIGLGE